ncbi:SusC/RagA family TonB-linked outer membrane protein [Aequorivita sp. 609]|uniref:SusC/RagA family TonB-linked outer membrane protein n=1 Tax=Aequorivita sp. 609 TaxID=2760087 RepID=UPI001613E8D3|nr:SusC/RagA family TonB-linked outer membrane protein [Aequorivita sp. 609]MBB6681373.1 SusC/RagA family TonB-linked outer membrane protein [Aequorivita sp. 609]
MEIKLIKVLAIQASYLPKSIARTLLLLSCTTIFGFSPNSLTYQNPEVTINQDRKVTIFEVFEIIGKQTECTFIYQSDIFKGLPKIELKKGTIKVNELLKQCLPPTDFNIITTKDNYITITRQSGKAFPQGNIKGVVKDSLGIDMAGVNIIIKNTSRGTQSDLDGEYTIIAHPSDTLVFTYMGYKTQEIAVGNRTIINVVMLADATALDAVVINAGYYDTTDKERTGSIGRVTAAEIDKQPINNPVEALQGRVTGVDIVQNSGIPGGGFKVRIRGQNSLMSGNGPLYIIDGVPYDTQSLGSRFTSGPIIPNAEISPLNAINPEAIESIEVLKDADATAIYGSRGANGVVLITTKKGKKGKTDLIVSSSTGVAHITRKTELLNTQQYLEMRKEAFANDGLTEYSEWDYDVNGRWDNSRYTDWQEELLGGTANTRKLFAQVSGGSNNTQFLINGQYQEETTVFPGTYAYDRITVNSNLNHQSRDERFKVVFTAGYSLEKNNLPTQDFTTTAFWLPPNAPSIYDEAGNINWEGSTWTNPLARLPSKYIQDSKSLLSNTVVSYSFLNDFEIKVNAGYGFSQLKGMATSPHTIYDPAYGYDSGASTLITSSGNRAYWITEPQIRWEKKIGSNKLEILLGSTFQEENYEQVSIMGKGFPTNSFINNMSAATTLTILDENSTNYKYHSLFGRVNYAYQNKLFVNATGRRDGSSRFGPKNKYGNFGALGAGWIFTEGMNLPWINLGKLRGSFGIAGNDQIGDYQYLQTYSIQDYSYDGNIGLLPARLYNPNFKWEKIIKREAAVEISLFDSKIALSTAYYNNRSSNQLVQYALPGTTGFTNILVNLDAEVENSGFEFEVNANVGAGNNFSWISSFNLSLPKNKLLAFPGLENSTYANRYEIGKPINIHKLYELKGVNPETGLFEFTDFNEDGEITNDGDRQYVADLSPKFFGGLSNTIKYKDWSLDFLFQFVKKNGYNQYRYSDPPGLMGNHTVRVLNRWQQPGDEAKMQRFTTGANYEAYLAYSQFTQSNGIISDASFIRLRSMEIAYNLRLGKEGSNNCRIFLQGLNLLTFTKFKDGDPEQTIGFIPPLRKISFGAQLHL